MLLGGVLVFLTNLIARRQILVLLTGIPLLTVQQQEVDHLFLVVTAKDECKMHFDQTSITLLTLTERTDRQPSILACLRTVEGQLNTERPISTAFLL